MTLLVIGASSDMGIALIDHIAERYDKIIAHYYHMNDSLKQIKDTYGDKIVLVHADLSSDEDLNRMIEMITKIEPAPCHVVHFPAQQIKLQKFIKTDWDYMERGFDISIKSVVQILQAILPKMIKKRYGRIVIMLSDAVVEVPPKYSADYVIAKYALLGLIKALSVEYADKGITVNGISPSFVDTKFVSGLADIIKEEHKNSSPTGRNLAPEDIVPSISFLLSEGALGINGQNISINWGGSK